MKTSPAAKRIAIQCICLLYILLFVYASVSKLLDFENFRVQIGLSPLISSFAGIISVMVPILEILIVIALLVSRFRLVGLFACFTLMTMFSSYIFIILNYGSFVPCSCGGILEAMDWNDHLVFNLFFMLLAAVAIVLYPTNPERIQFFKRSYKLALFTLLGIGTVTLLYVQSEKAMHYDNHFTRRFLPHAVMRSGSMELGLNSYYFAGYDSSKIYLANYTTPAKMTVIDQQLKGKSEHKMLLDHHAKFHSITIKVRPPFFYIADGTTPYLFKGTINDWRASRQNISSYFSLFEPFNDNTLAIRKRSKKDEYILARANCNTGLVKESPGLLEKQMDGVFDTDGTLLYSSTLKKVVYVYYYRNQFIVADDNLKLSYRGKTIDTTSRAQLQVAYLKEKQMKQFSAPPHMVNRNTAVHRNLLFVNSGLRSTYESARMWKDASVIDVYDISKNTYEFSFYIYDANGKKMNSFIVTDGYVYALVDNKIDSYQLNTSFLEKFAR